MELPSAFGSAVLTVFWAGFGSDRGGAVAGPDEVIGSGAAGTCSGAATGTNLASTWYAANGTGGFFLSVTIAALEVLPRTSAEGLAGVSTLAVAGGEPPDRVATNHTPSVSTTPVAPLPDRISHFLHGAAI